MLVKYPASQSSNDDVGMPVGVPQYLGLEMDAMYIEALFNPTDMQMANYVKTIKADMAMEGFVPTGFAFGKSAAPTFGGEAHLNKLAQRRLHYNGGNPGRLFPATRQTVATDLRSYYSDVWRRHNLHRQEGVSADFTFIVLTVGE